MGTPPEIESERQAYIDLHAGYGFSFERGLEVLESALAIGRQADGLALDQVRSRMETARRNATRKAWSRELRLLSKLKSWFATPKQPEPVG